MYGVKDLPVEMSNFREVKGSGYEVSDVIKQIQLMMKEYKALEEAWQLKTWNKEYTKPEPFRRVRLRAARTTGYAVEDVKKYLQTLEEKIVYMRAKLDVVRDQKNWNQEWQDN